MCKKSKQKGVKLKVIFAGESKTTLKRKELDPGYKGNRPNISDPAFKEFRTGLAELIRLLGWDIISVDGAEADDVIASIVAKYCHRCLGKTPVQVFPGAWQCRRMCILLPRSCFCDWAS